MTTTIPKFAHLQIPLEDVLNATNNFHDDNIIGRGGFGPAYKGQLQRSGKLIKIAARRLDRTHGEGHVEFWTEISALSDLKHTNLVSIVGFCNEKDEKIIITTYAANGSLREHLNNPNLTWTQRLRISVGVARALSYLHYDEGRGYGFIHRNVNSSTILLDEKWEAKLSGFEISIKQAVNRMDQITLSEPIGTIGYVDPEIEKSKGVTCKSDIYAFGVVLFEILCGRRAYIKNDANRLLATLVMHHYEKETLPDIIHPDLKNQMSRHQISIRSLRIYSETAFSCLKEERSHRPHIFNIVNELEKALEKALKFQPRPENFGNNLEHLKIELHDIKLATHNFSDTNKTNSSKCYTWYTVELRHFAKENPSFIEGISKSKLFKRHDTFVIKRFLPEDDEFEEELFFTELEVLANVKHHNIVSLIGFCVEGFERILVTEKLSIGFLGNCLGDVREMRNLTWEKRLKICIDGAHALNYLHYEMDDKKVMIHSHIDSFKFGLDENGRAKIEDFEFAVFLPPNQEDETLCKRTYFRSKYHVDPEYAKIGKLKRESDVYSFGVVLFEILCGREAGDQIYLKESEKGLVHVARRNFYNGTIEDVIDPTLKEETGKKICNPINKDSLYTFLKVADQCVAETQDQRPTMKVVLKELQKALVFQVIQEEQVHEPNMDQVVDELQITTFQTPENPDQMWAKVVAAIHQNRNTAQLVPFKTSVPGVWKDIGSMDSKLSKLGIDLTQCLTQNNGSWSWRNDEEQLFSVKQVRKDLEIARLAGIPDDPCFSWNTWATPKANFLLWRVLIDRIASRENLIKRGVQLDDEFCPRCGLSLESRDHIFLSCIWARCIWWNVLAWVRIKYPVEVYSFREFLDYVNQCPGSKVWKHIIQLIILATVWRIWNARNEKVFEGRFIPINTSVDLIKEDSFVWLSNRANARRPLWDSWKMFDVVNLL